MVIVCVERLIGDTMDEARLLVAQADYFTTGYEHTSDESRAGHRTRPKETTITQGEGAALCQAQQKCPRDEIGKPTRKGA